MKAFLGALTILLFISSAIGQKPKDGTYTYSIAYLQMKQFTKVVLITNIQLGVRNINTAA